MNDLLLVFIAALITALATGLGAAPFAFSRNMSDRVLGYGHAIAGGSMIGASIGLVIEGSRHGTVSTWLGAVLGLVVIAVGMRWLKQRQGITEPIDEAVAAHADKLVSQSSMLSRGAILVGIMTLHSFSEGIGVGVSWGGGEPLGWFVTLAMAIHNIPEGLAISLVLINQGSSVAKAAWMSIVSSLPQPLVAVPAFLFVEQFRTVLPWGLGIAAGAMVWMCVSDLIPEARNALSRQAVAATVMMALIGMLLMQRALVV